MFTKTTYEEFFRYMDFTNWLNTGENLSQASGTVTDKETGQSQASMISDVAVYQNKKAIYKIKAGTKGKIYTVAIQVISSNSQKFEGQVDCKII